MKFTGGLPETPCGAGSTLATTAYLRSKLPDLLRDLLIQFLIDAPCGDFNWMAHTDLSGIDYLGCEVNEEILQLARSKKSLPGCAPIRSRFAQIDILSTKLPVADGVLCRDFLQHLPNELAMRAMGNVASSKWLLATSHSNAVNDDIRDVGQFRPLNLMAPPFCFPPPKAMIEDPPGSGRIIGAWMQEKWKV